MTLFKFGTKSTAESEMNNMKKNKYIFLGVMISVVVIVLLTVYMTTSYLMDFEVADNIITIGNVEASIDESPFTSGSFPSAAAGTVIGKAPKVKNTGKNDEYVFLTITVPKKNATFLIESGTDRGKKDSGTNPRNAQIFKVLTNGSGTIGSLSGTDVTFEYHNYVVNTPGWYFLGQSLGSDSDVYTFGYNKKLAPNETSVALFDKIQMKSIIDTNVSGAVSVLVNAYAIQADNLNLSGTSGTASYLTEAQITELYGIVTRKKAG